ncbi:hypothetical protein ACF0H5_016767 [Mactra antiquata]
MVRFEIEFHKEPNSTDQTLYYAVSYMQIKGLSEEKIFIKHYTKMQWKIEIKMVGLILRKHNKFVSASTSYEVMLIYTDLIILDLLSLKLDCAQSKLSENTGQLFF